jgi:hypothetical protein
MLLMTKSTGRPIHRRPVMLDAEDAIYERRRIKMPDEAVVFDDRG